MARTPENFLFSTYNCRSLRALPLVVGAGIGLVFSGCATHNIDPKPKPTLDHGRATSSARTSTNISPVLAPWWTAFQSRELDGLIAKALAQNLDLQAAVERYEQALSQARRSGGAARPKLELTGEFSRDVSTRERARRDDGLEGGIGLDWEIDLWRKLGSARLALEAEAEGRAFAVNAYQLSLTASVAEVYFNIIEQRQLLLLLSEQRKTSAALFNIISNRYDEGLISKLDVLQQQSQLAEIDSLIPAAEGVLLELNTRLGALLGDLPGGTPGLPDGTGAVGGGGAGFPVFDAVTLVSQLETRVLQRPDLSEARAKLVAADAETGRALAERLPRLRLSADAIWTEGGARVISIGADLLQPLLDWGGRREEWVRTKAVYRERLALFSQAYIRALWEIDGLVKSEAKQRELLASLEVRKNVLVQTVTQARNRYDAGLTDYLPVLSVTQQLYAVEQRLIREQRRLATLRISLHQALGGAQSF